MPCTSLSVGAVTRWLRTGLLAGIWGILLFDGAFAATYSGIVESVSPAQDAITIRVVSTDKTYAFKLDPTARIVSGTKAIQLEDIEVGQTATVTTIGATLNATKVSVRATAAAKAKPQGTKKKVETPERMPDNPAQPVAVGDWPQYRGPNRDNISQETGLLESWPEAGPPLLWTTEGLGEGFSSVAVVGELILTLGSRGNEEMLFALDRESGKPVWSIRIGQNRADGMGGGPRGTPTVDGSKVYALGANGDLVCVELADGRGVWSQNILQEFGGGNIVWGISESVLIDGEQLICTPGGKSATVAALDKKTGRPIWRSVIPGAPQAAYSSPIAVNVGNVRQYVNFVHTGVVGVRASDGEPLWGQQASANDTANCSTPLAIDNLIFTASGYDTGGACFRLAARGNNVASEVVYTTREMKNHHGGMVVLDGYIYGFNEQILTCLEARTGQRAWQNRSVGKGAVTFADGKLYLRSEGGPLALARATEKGYEELGRFEQPRRSGRPAWAHPVVAGKRLYVRDQDVLLAFDLRQ